MDRPELAGILRVRGAFLVRAAAWARQTAAPVPWSAAGATARACAAALALVLGGAAHADTDVNSWIARSSGSWMEASSWSLGVVPWNDPRTHYLAIIPAAAPGSLTVTIGSAIPVIDALSIGEGAELEILAGAGLALAGGAIDNHGVIGLWASFGQPVTLRLEPEESVISGSGEIIAGDPAATICALLPNGRLVHAKGHRLTGAMALGADSMRLSNEGEIVAANGKITVDLSDGAGLNFNSGRLAAEAPGALLLQDLSLDNAGGVIESMPGAKVRLHGVSLMGGTLRDVDGAGPGSLRVTGDTSLEGVVVDGPISIGNFAYLRLRAGTHIGDLHQEGEAGISTTVRLETTPFTVPTGAMWTEAGGSANAITSAATTHTLLVETGATIAGGQRVGADSLRLENHGVIEASSATPMLVDLSNGDGINFNHGTMRAANGATLVIADCSIDNTDGVIEAAPGSIVRFGIGTYPNVGRVTRIAGGVIRRVDGDVPGRIEVVETLRIDSGTIVDAPVHVGALFWDSNYPPTLWVSPGGQVPAVVLLGGTDFPYAHAMLFSDAPVAEFANCEVTALPNASSQMKRVAGPWNPQTSALIMDSARFQGQIEFAFRSGVVNHGRIEAGPTESIVFTTNGQVIENASSGILRLAPAPTSRTATWVGSLVNHGDFELGAPRKVILSAGTFTQQSGIASIDGTIQLSTAQPPVRVNGGVLAGIGAVAKRTENLGGVVAPGSAGGIGTVGTLSITIGEFVQGPAGVLDIDLGAPADSSVNPGDRVAVTGAAIIDGTLRVRIVKGFVPSPGESFAVLTASSVSGTFTTIESIDHCEPFEVAYGPSSVSVVFTGAPSADLNGDGVVAGDDLGALLGAWGDCAETCCSADLNGDGAVDGDDLGVLLGAWS